MTGFNGVPRNKAFFAVCDRPILSQNIKMLNIRFDDYAFSKDSTQIKTLSDLPI